MTVRKALVLIAGAIQELGSGDTLLPIATQAEMESGTETASREMNPAGIKQAIIALAPGGSSGGATTVSVFTASGTWSKPANLVGVKVTVIGGGGGGGDAYTSSNSDTSAGGGGGGGMAVKFIPAGSLASSVTVTRGAGGAGATTNGATGGAGGTSSFGAHCSATGGAGGVGALDNVWGALGGAPGNGSGGDINATGGTGGTSHRYGGGEGGDTMLGFGGPGAVDRNGVVTQAIAGTGYGSGGGGGTYVSTGPASVNGANGAGGIIIVEEYF